MDRHKSINDAYSAFAIVFLIVILKFWEKIFLCTWYKQFIRSTSYIINCGTITPPYNTSNCYGIFKHTIAITYLVNILEIIFIVHICHVNHH